MKTNKRKYFYKHDALICVEITHGEFLRTIQKCNDFLYDFIIETDQTKINGMHTLIFYIVIRSKQS